MKNKLIFASILLATLFAYNLDVFAQTTTTTENFVTISQVQALEKQINTLDQTNNKILNTIYWALGGLITVFLAVVGLNFFQNFSLNKNKFNTFKEKVRAELSADKEKMLTTIQSEKDTVNLATQKMLSDVKSQVEKNLAELNTKLDSKIKSSVSASLKEHESKIQEIQANYEDVQRDNLVRKAFEHKQKGQMGYIYNLIKTLELDIKKDYDWQINETLERIITCLNEGVKNADSMAELNSVLATLPKKYDFQKKNIEAKMSL